MTTIWDKLAERPVSELTAYLRDEYPQTVAVAVTRLPTAVAAAVLDELPSSFAVDVMMRISRLSNVNHSAVEILERVIAEDFDKIQHNHMAALRTILEGTQQKNDFLAAIAERNRVTARQLGATMPETSDDLEAEWNALAETSDPITSETSTRMFTQDEIDRLLGFDEQHGTAFDALLAATRKVDFPVLDAVFCDFSRMFAKCLRSNLLTNVDVSLDQVCTIRCCDLINTTPLPAMFAPFSGSAFFGTNLWIIDSALIYSVIDLMFGGKSGTAAMRIEGRPYTKVERCLLESIMNIALGALGVGFSRNTEMDPSFTLHRIETNPRFVEAAQGDDLCVLAKFRVDMDDRGGRLALMIPYAALDDVRSSLKRQRRTAKWENHFTERLLGSTVEVTATLGHTTVSLGELTDLQPGDMLFLKPGIGLSVNGHPIGGGTLTTTMHRHAITLDDILKDSAS